MADRGGDRVYRVIYEALADYSKFFRETDKAEQRFKDIERSEVRESRTAVKANQEAEQSTDERQSAVKRLTGAIQDLGKQTDKLSAADRNRSRSAQLSAKQEDELAESRDRVAQASLNLEKATYKAEKAQKTYNSSLQSGDIDKQRSALLSLRDAQLQVERSTREVSKATIQLNDDIDRIGGRGSFGNFFRDVIGGFGGASNAARDFGVALNLLKFPVIIFGIKALISALSALSAGLLGVAGAVAPLAGALASLPQAYLGLATVFGTVIGATAGLGQALGALDAQQKASADNAKAAADAQAAAAEQVKAAQQSLADARRNLADTYRSSADAIEAAENGVRDAQEAARIAQEGLTQAREDAKIALDDLRDSVEGLRLSEERASLSLREARRRYQEVLADPNATRLEIESAALAVREAEYSLQQARERTREQAKELREEEKKGINQSDEVVAARQAIRDANQNLADSQEALTQAQVDGARSIKDAQRGVKEAQKQLADAMKAQAEAASELSTEDQALKEAMEDLSPAARKFVRQLYAMKPILDNIRKSAQRGLLPGLGVALNKVVDLAPLVNRTLFKTGQVIGDLAIKGAEMMTSGPWRRDFKSITESNLTVIENIGNALLSVIDAIRNVAAEAQPLTEWFGRLAERGAEYVQTASEVNRENGDMADFFDKTKHVIEVLGGTLKNLTDVFYDIISAGSDMGTGLLEDFEKITKKWSEWTSSIEGRNAIKDWYEESEPLFREIIGLVKDLAVGIFSLGRDTGMVDFVQAIRQKLLPAIFDLGDAVGGELGVKLVDLVTQLVELADAFLYTTDQLGGMIEVFTTFFDVINTILQKVPGATEALGFLFTAFATIKAIKFVGIITGLGGLLTAVHNLGDTGRPQGRLSQFVTGIQNIPQATKTAVTNTATGFRQLGGLTKNLGQKLGGLQTGAGLAAGALGALSLKMATGDSSVSKAAGIMGSALSGALLGFSASAGTGPGAGIGAAIGAGVGLLGGLAAAFYDSGDAAAEASAQVGDYGDTLNQTNGAITQSTRDMAAAKLEARDALDAADDLGLSYIDLTDAVTKSGPAQEKFLSNLEDTKTKLEQELDALQNAAGQSGVYNEASREQQDALQGRIDKLKLVIDSIKEENGDLKDNQEQVRNTADAAKEHVSALEAQRNALDQAKNALEDYNAEFFESRDAARSYQQSIDDANKAIKENGRTLDINTQKGRDNQEALDDLADSAQQYLSKLRTKDPQKYAAELEKVKQRLYETARRFGMGEKAARKYADQVIRIPERVKSNLEFNAGEAIRKVKNFKKWYDSLNPYKKLQVDVWFKRRDIATRSRIAENAEQFHAAGGFVSGPGTSTSDSIPARLSDGEFVVNAKATAQNLPLLHRINRGYARGGLVQRFAQGGMAGGWLSFFGLTANLEPLESVARQAGRRFSQALNTSMKVSGFLSKPLRQEIRQANQEMRAFKPQRMFSEPMTKAIREVKKAFREFRIKQWFSEPLKDAVREVSKYLKNVIDNFRDNIKDIRGALDDFKPADWVERALENLVTDSDRAMDKMVTSFERGTERSENEFERFEQNLDRIWDKIDRTFDTSQQRIVQGMERFATGLGNQWEKIRNQMGRPVAFVINRIINAGLIGHLNKILKQLNVKTINPSGELHFARGGKVPGTGDQDSVRARLMPGEFVLRKKIVKEIGEPALNALNEGTATDWKRRRYKEGGRVMPVGEGPVSGQYAGHDGIDFPRPYGTPIHAAAPGVTSYKGWGRGYGLAVFERGPYGELVYGHMARTSTKVGERLHAGEIIGYVDDTGNSSGNHLHFGFPGDDPSKAWAFLRGADVVGGGAGWAGIPMIDYAARLSDALKKLRSRMREGTAGTPLPRMTRAAGSMAMNAAIEYVRSKQAEMGAFGIPNLAGISGPAKKIVQQIAAKWGWGKGAQWAALAQLVMHESSFNPSAQNPTSTAYGLFQFLDSTWSTVGGHKTSDPKLQTVYGLRYIKQRYGSPIGAWNFWQSHNWYNKGGYVDGTNQGRDSVPAMLTPGEFVFNRRSVKRFGLKRLEELNSGRKMTHRGAKPQMFHEGGVVKGLKQGASGKAVSAIESEVFWPEDGKWDAGLSALLKRKGIELWPKRVKLAGSFRGRKNKSLLERLIKFLKGKKIKITPQHFRGSRSFSQVADRFGGKDSVAKVYLTNKSFFDYLDEAKSKRFLEGVRKYAHDHEALKPFKNLNTEVKKGVTVRERSKQIKEYLRKARTKDIPRSVGGGGTFDQLANKLNIPEGWLHFIYLAGLKKIGDQVPKDKRSAFAKSHADFMKDRKGWIKVLQKKIGIKPATGQFGKREQSAMKHVLAHAFGKKHDRWSPRPWKPLTALDKAIKNQAEANKKQAEFNNALDIIAGWGLTDLLNWLIDQGVESGYKIAIEASKNKAKATELNEKIKRGNELTADQVFEVSRFIAAIANHPNPQPGLRDMANALQLPDYAIYDLWNYGSARIRKAVGVGRLGKLQSDIAAFSQGIFYAAKGGHVPGRGSGDRVPAMLEPGEFVLRKDAVKRVGLDSLFRINDPQKFALGGLVGNDRVAAGSMAGTRIININTTINNPVGENSVASFNRNLRSKAAMGVFGRGGEN